MRITRPAVLGLALALAGLVALPASAVDPVNTGFFGSVAIRGYDPVAYFTLGAPTRGTSEFQADWRGATWRFANADHLARFRAEPERYAPQYGGYCAYAVSQGYTAHIDPAAWHIRQDKLYLNLDLDIRELWLKDVADHIARADAHWPRLLAE